jgi:hypothetical protein
MKKIILLSLCMTAFLKFYAQQSTQSGSSATTNEDKNLERIRQNQERNKMEQDAMKPQTNVPQVPDQFKLPAAQKWEPKASTVSNKTPEMVNPVKVNLQQLPNSSNTTVPVKPVTTEKPAGRTQAETDAANQQQVQVKTADKTNTVIPQVPDQFKLPDNSKGFSISPDRKTNGSQAPVINSNAGQPLNTTPVVKEWKTSGNTPKTDPVNNQTSTTLTPENKIVVSDKKEDATVKVKETTAVINLPFQSTSGNTKPVANKQQTGIIKGGSQDPDAKPIATQQNTTESFEQLKSKTEAQMAQINKQAEDKINQLQKDAAVKTNTDNTQKNVAPAVKNAAMTTLPGMGTGNQQPTLNVPLPNTQGTSADPNVKPASTPVQENKPAVTVDNKTTTGTTPTTVNPVLDKIKVIGANGDANKPVDVKKQN